MSNKMGRPVKYTLEFCLKEIQGFLKVLMDEGDKYKCVTWQDLVKNKSYSRQRISEWREKYDSDELFSDTIKKIDSELENRLFKLGLSGKANPTLVIFGLKNNYGWKDRQELGHTGIPPSNINVTVDNSETAETLKKLRNGS